MESMSPSPTPFAWVHKRDGRLVPFEADRISRALFAAAESLGRPDAFLARELTDSILHFLRTEACEATPTTAQIAELVVKVVRELGQPALAKAFAEAQTRKAESGKQAEEDHRQSDARTATPPGFPSNPSIPSYPLPVQLCSGLGKSRHRQVSLGEPPVLVYATTPCGRSLRGTWSRRKQRAC